MNKICLIGRLTKDPELKYTKSNKAVCSFVLAVNRTFKSEGQPDADFISIVTWNKQAENLSKYMNKGSQIGVCGRVQTRNYDNENGVKVYVTEVIADEIIFLESKNSSDEQHEEEQEETTNAYEDFGREKQSEMDFSIDDDDLPF